MSRFATLVLASGLRLGVNLDHVVSIEPVRFVGGLSRTNQEKTHSIIMLAGGGSHEIKANSEKLTAELERRAKADRGARDTRSLFDQVFGPAGSRL